MGENNISALRTAATDERAALAQAEQMAGQLLRRAQVAVLHQVQVLRRLEACLQKIAGFGFVPVSFTAYALEAPTITIEAPEDALIDALESRYSVCGKFQRDGSTLWLSIDGIRVQWTIERESLPEAA